MFYIGLFQFKWYYYNWKTFWNSNEPTINTSLVNRALEKLLTTLRINRKLKLNQILFTPLPVILQIKMILMKTVLSLSHDQVHDRFTLLTGLFTIIIAKKLKQYSVSHTERTANNCLLLWRLECSGHLILDRAKFLHACKLTLSTYGLSFLLIVRKDQKI